MACFSSDQTITETEVGKFFITFFQDCDTDIVVKLGVIIIIIIILISISYPFFFNYFLPSFFQFEQFKLYLNLLASILLHPPSDFPEIKQVFFLFLFLLFLFFLFFFFFFTSIWILLSFTYYFFFI